MTPLNCFWNATAFAGTSPNDTQNFVVCSLVYLVFFVAAGLAFVWYEFLNGNHILWGSLIAGVCVWLGVCLILHRRECPSPTPSAPTSPRASTL